MRLFVHFHIYYSQHVDFFLDMMKNINSVQWDLFVTSPHIDEAIVTKIRDFKPDARIEHVDNKGYDIWPFIYAVKNICLEAYDCILKLHTKGPLSSATHLNGIVLRDFMWRDALVEALLGSPEVFRSNMDMFSEHHDLGMIFSDKLYIKANFREDGRALITELRRLGFRTCHRRFCAGTMFMIRPQAVQYLASDLVYEDMFNEPLKSHSNGSMSHIYERILTLATLAQGYKVHTVGVPMTYKAYFRVHRWVQPVLSFLFSIERRGAQMKKYLTILGIRIKLDDGIQL